MSEHVDEADLRLAHLEADRWMVRTLVVAMVGLILVYLPLEWATRFESGRFQELAALRGVGGAALLILYCVAGRVRTVAGLDQLVAALLTVGITTLAGINWVYGMHFSIDLLLILAIYAVLPAPLWMQLLSATLLTLVDLYIDQWVMQIPDQNDAIATHLFAHVLGVVLSRRRRSRRQARFLALSREKALRRSLEAALAEVRTLSGLLPICSVCKKVRNEAVGDGQGTWQDLESFLAEHSDARLTHGYCPDCARAALESAQAEPAAFS